MAEKQNASLEFIELKKIKPLSNRPIDEKDPEFQELLQSVKAQGIEQAVLLRPNNGHYDLVAGGRRFKAAQLAGLELIPALIKPLNDEEARLAQLTENIQRQPLTPIQESEMYKRLLDLKLTTKQVSEKVGKSLYYVETRAQLIHLIKGFQDILNYRNIPLEQAIAISRLPKNSQESLWEAIRKEVAKLKVGERYRWNFENYMAQLQGKLSEAPFDIKSEELYKEAGSCVKCPKNSNNMGNLFVDELNKNAVCTDRACWNIKAAALFKSKLLAAIEKGYVIGMTRYGAEKNNKLAADCGAKVEVTNDWNEVSRPSKPQKQSWQNKKDFAEEIKSWERSVEKWKEYTESGKIFPVFMINGNSEGKVIYFSKAALSVEKRGGGSEKPKMAELPKAQQITRIKENLERKDDIEMSAMTEQVYETLQKTYAAKIQEDDKPLTVQEKLLLISILSDNGKELSRSNITAFVKNNLEKPRKDLDQIINRLVRQNFFSRCKPSKESRPNTDIAGMIVFEFAKKYSPQDLKKMEEAYAVEQKKRHDRAKERTKALK